MLVSLLYLWKQIITYQLHWGGAKVLIGLFLLTRISLNTSMDKSLLFKVWDQFIYQSPNFSTEQRWSLGMDK